MFVRALAEHWTTRPCCSLVPLAAEQPPLCQGEPSSSKRGKGSGASAENAAPMLHPLAVPHGGLSALGLVLWWSKHAVSVTA